LFLSGHSASPSAIAALDGRIHFLSGRSQLKPRACPSRWTHGRSRHKAPRDRPVVNNSSWKLVSHHGPSAERQY
jgi:hypothetical protein